MSEEDKNIIAEKTGTHVSLIPNWGIVSVLIIVFTTLVGIGGSYTSAITRIDVLEKKQSQMEVFITENAKEQQKIITNMVRTNDELIFNLKIISQKLHVKYVPKDEK